jgi:FkbM family methyltransferase
MKKGVTVQNFKAVLLFTAFCLSESSWCSQVSKIMYCDSLVPSDVILRRRIVTTVACDDCSYLPKVEYAGKVIQENGIEIQMMHNGIKVLKDSYYGAWATKLIELCKGHHEPQEEKIFYEVLKYLPVNAVMLELGSYWSYYSMWFQKDIEHAQTFLIEPDPKNIVIGQKNFSLNNMTGHFTQAMLGECSKDSEKFIDWDYNEHHVKQVCVDDFAVEHGIKFIHILHSDIQGAEVSMLKGCKRLIAEKRIGYFFISTHRGVHEDCLKILQDSQLEIILSYTREESFSADGLIVARLPGMPGPSHIEVSRREKCFSTLVDALVKE